MLVKDDMDSRIDAVELCDAEKTRSAESDSELLEEEEEIHSDPISLRNTPVSELSKVEKRKPLHTGIERKKKIPKDVVDGDSEKRKPANSDSELLGRKGEEEKGIHSNTSRDFIIPCGVLFGVLCLYFALFCFYNGRPNSDKSSNNVHNISYFRKVTLNTILKKYPSQPQDMIKTFFYAVDDVYNGSSLKDSSSVITILHCKDCKGTAHCIASDFAKYASEILNRTGKFERFDGSSQDDLYNFCIGCNDFKEKLIKNGVLVVYNFHELSPERAKLFHGLCDKYTPYVKSKVIYIILLEIGTKQEVVSKLMEKVHLRINELWSVLESHILDPLVTRLSENIIDIKQEKQLFEC